MKREFALLLALCAFAAASVPRDRRAVDLEELQPAATTSTERPRNICALSTPCGWAFYKPAYKMIEMEVVNTYCVCGAGLDCLIDEDDRPVNAFVKKCKLPGKGSELVES